MPPQLTSGYEECTGPSDSGLATTLIAFGVGVLAGAIAVLLTTPDSGPSMRRRLGRGAAVAKKEMEGVLGDITEDLGVLRDRAREAIHRTGSRLGQAAEATKDALAADEQAQPPIRPV